jgi:hypothetical protein
MGEAEGATREDDGSVDIIKKFDTEITKDVLGAGACIGATLTTGFVGLGVCVANEARKFANNPTTGQAVGGFVRTAAPGLSQVTNVAALAVPLGNAAEELVDDRKVTVGGVVLGNLNDALKNEDVHRILNAKTIDRPNNFSIERKRSTIINVDADEVIAVETPSTPNNIFANAMHDESHGK